MLCGLRGAQTGCTKLIAICVFESCAVYDGTQTKSLMHSLTAGFESCAVYEGAQTGCAKLIAIYVFEG